MERLFKIRASQASKILTNGKVKGELSVGCKTYLREWYANENEQIHSKYIDKGNEVENDLIDFMAIELGYGMSDKNEMHASNEFIQGTCDVITHDSIVDVKACWGLKTLHETAFDGLNKDYEAQIQCYMELYNRDKGIVFHGLMNTPSTDYSEEVFYEDMPNKKRWVAFEVKRDRDFIQLVNYKVLQCREWLENYELELNSKLGNVL